MKTAEEWAKDEFGFTYIDDVEPQTRTAFGTSALLKQIQLIQLDAYKAGMIEAAEIADSQHRLFMDCFYANRPFTGLSICQQVANMAKNKQI